MIIFVSNEVRTGSDSDRVSPKLKELKAQIQIKTKPKQTPRYRFGF